MKSTSQKHPNKKSALLKIVIWCALALTILWLANPIIEPQIQKAKDKFSSLVGIHGKNHKKAQSLTLEIEEMIAQHDSLPKRHELGMFSFQPNKKSNSLKIDKLSANLATELGNSRILGSISALNTLRNEEENIKATIKQTPKKNLEEKTKKALEKNQKQQEALIEEIQKTFHADDMPLSKEEILSLAMSPNHQETASLIIAFGSIKKISLTMEQRMREKPSQESAQKYYGTHAILLQSLNRIQRQAMHKIVNEYLPKSEEIAQAAQLRINEAETLIKKESKNLSENQKLALESNILSCRTTIKMAETTEEKLRKNLRILIESNYVLLVAIKTAENSHATALLQKEIISLANSHHQEILDIEKLIIPKLAAINFADPTNPKVLPSKEKTNL